MERIEMPQEQPTAASRLGGWQTIIIVVVTWLVATAVNWGVLQAHQEDMARRQDGADRAISQELPRVEFDTWRDEVNRRLERIEEKMDTLLLQKEK